MSKIISPLRTLPFFMHGFCSAAALLASLLLVAPLGAAPLATIKERKVLRVGVEPGFLPFEMQSPKSEWLGFDVMMMQAFTAKIGVKAEFVAAKWDGIIPGLMAGKYDLITSGMTITEERAKTVLFSDPYYEAGLKVLLGTKAKTAKKWEELDEPSRTIVVKLGTTGDIFASKNIKKAQIRRLDSEADAAQSVLLGKADAFIYDRPYLEIYQARHGDRLGLLPTLLSSENFGVAAKKSDTELVAAFNNFLKEWRATGAYDKAYQAMFVDLSWKSQFPQLF